MTVKLAKMQQVFLISGSANKHVSANTTIGYNNNGKWCFLRGPCCVISRTSLESVKSCCSWVWGQFRNPEEAFGSRYQTTGEDTAGWEDWSVCSSELYSVWISRTVVITYSHGFVKSSVNPITNPNSVYCHSITWHYLQSIIKRFVTTWTTISHCMWHS
jgi:hypothetical protein